MNSISAIERIMLQLFGWDPLGWVHDMDWYREMLRADWFQSIRPYWFRYRLDWVAAVVVLLLIVMIIWSIRKILRRSRRKGIFKEGQVLPEKLAQQFEQKGEFRLAAEQYQIAELPEKAYELFLEAECLHEAAEIAAGLGRVDEAVELFERSNDQASALRVVQESGDLDRAAEYHRRRGTQVEAAQMFLEASQPAKAAEMFAEAGMLTRAAEALFEAGQDIAAAEYLVEFAQKSASEFTHVEADLMLRAAKSLANAGRNADSARLLMGSKQYEQAAERYLAAGDKKLAASCFEKAGDLEQAADLFEKAGEKKERVRVMELMRRAGKQIDDRDYVQALEEAGLHERASQSYQEMGLVEAAVTASVRADQPGEAAAILAEQGRFEEAAKLYLEAGDPAAAREQFLSAKNPKGAALAALQAAMYFEAGKDFFALNDMPRTVDSLQNVSDSHPDYQTASSLLGQAFNRLGDLEMALRMHRRAVEKLKFGRDNLELFYQLARFLESSSDGQLRKEAKQIYTDILTENYTFKDVKSRNDSLTD
ncbi:MAG: hypothetical protein JRJ87_18715 [Deltaproteobacteria bacterium]|nr:hypothetical protein [Deltaproteobacteria bacterium]